MTYSRGHGRSGLPTLLVSSEKHYITTTRPIRCVSGTSSHRRSNLLSRHISLPLLSIFKTARKEPHCYPLCLYDYLESSGYCPCIANVASRNTMTRGTSLTDRPIRRRGLHQTCGATIGSFMGWVMPGGVDIFWVAIASSKQAVPKNSGICNIHGNGGDCIPDRISDRTAHGALRVSAYTCY